MDLKPLRITRCSLANIDLPNPKMRELLFLCIAEQLVCIASGKFAEPQCATRQVSFRYGRNVLISHNS
jgi:hypothetical protein